MQKPQESLIADVRLGSINTSGIGFTVEKVYCILEVRPKAHVKLCLIDVDRLKLLKRPQDVISNIFFKMHFCIVVFSILTIGRHIDM